MVGLSGVYFIICKIYLIKNAKQPFLDLIPSSSRSRREFGKWLTWPIKPLIWGLKEHSVQDFWNILWLGKKGHVLRVNAIYTHHLCPLPWITKKSLVWLSILAAACSGSLPKVLRNQVVKNLIMRLAYQWYILSRCKASGSTPSVVGGVQKWCVLCQRTQAHRPQIARTAISFF